MILNHYHIFLASILDDLNKLGVDVSGLDMDHIGYQASSDADYDRLTKELEKLGDRVSEVMVMVEPAGPRLAGTVFYFPLCERSRF